MGKRSGKRSGKRGSKRAENRAWLEAEAAKGPSLGERIATGLFILGLLIPILLSLVLSIFGLHKYSMGKDSVNWPSTKATIVSVIVVRNHRSSSTGMGAERRRTSSTSYEVKASYRYQVKGESYGGKTLVVSKSSRADAEVEARKYAPGQVLGPVFYDPQAPKHHVEEQGLRWPGLFMMGLALFFFGLCCGVLWRQVRSKKGTLWRPAAVAAGLLLVAQVVGILTLT